MRRHAEPLSACDILPEPRETNAKTALPTVYGALTALTKRVGVNCLEPLDAHIVCQRDSRKHASIFSIRGDCGSIEENAALNLTSKLSSVIKQTGFAATRHMIKVHGTCASRGTRRVPQ